MSIYSACSKILRASSPSSSMYKMSRLSMPYCSSSTDFPKSPTDSSLGLPSFTTGPTVWVLQRGTVLESLSKVVTEETKPVVPIVDDSYNFSKKLQRLGILYRDSSGQMNLSGLWLLFFSAASAVVYRTLNYIQQREALAAGQSSCVLSVSRVVDGATIELQITKRGEDTNSLDELITKINSLSKVEAEAEANGGESNGGVGKVEAEAEVNGGESNGGVGKVEAEAEANGGESNGGKPDGESNGAVGPKPDGESNGSVVPKPDGEVNGGLMCKAADEEGNGGVVRDGEGNRGVF